jgi:hypothetical protein
MYYGHPPDYEAPPPYGYSESAEPLNMVEETDTPFIERIRHMLKENKGDTDRRLDKLKQDMTLSHAQLQHQLLQLQTIEKAHLDQKTQETIRNIMLVFEDRFNTLERDVVDTIRSTMAWLDTIPVLESRHSEMSERIKELTQHVTIIQSQFQEMDQFVRKNELIARIQSLTDATHTKEQDIKRMLIQHMTEHENQLEHITASNELVKRQLVKHIEELSQKEIKHQEQLFDIEVKLDALQLRDELKGIIERIKVLEEREEKKQYESMMRHGRMEEIEKGVLFYDSNLSQRDKDDLQSKISILMNEFENYTQPPVGSGTGAVDESIIKKLFNHIRKNNETIFLRINPLNPKLTFIVITDKNVYYLKPNPDDERGIPPEASSTICLLYSFHNQLNYASMLFLINNLINRRQIWPLLNAAAAPRSISDMLTQTFQTSAISNTPIEIKSLEKFEQIIRLMPGSFKNRDWVALDGFFGLYFNPSTYEVLDGPPLFEFEKRVTVSSSSVAGGIVSPVKKREKSVSELMAERSAAGGSVSQVKKRDVSELMADALPILKELERGSAGVKPPYVWPQRDDLSKINDVFGGKFLLPESSHVMHKVSEIAPLIVAEIKKEFKDELLAFIDYSYSKAIPPREPPQNYFMRLNYLNLITNKGNIYAVEFCVGGGTAFQNMSNPSVYGFGRWDLDIKLVKYEETIHTTEKNWSLLNMYTKTHNGIEEELKLGKVRHIVWKDGTNKSVYLGNGILTIISDFEK